MIIGTHNSLSSYPCKRWYLAPFNFLTKCQDKSLEEQFSLGCRSFDLRFTKVKDKYYAAHGMQIYNITLEETMRKLNKLSRRSHIRFRVMFENMIVKNQKEEVEKLAMKIKALFNISNFNNFQNPEVLYVRSKKDSSISVISKQFDKNYADFDDDYSITENDRDCLCAKVAFMYELQTTDDKINCVACYESGGVPIRIFGWQPKVFGFPLQIPLPRVAANALTRIALNKKWKDNDLVIVDFL
jgi:hypothetical protein